MNAKLTLKLDSTVIGSAKAYAERRGVSLSALVESYFKALTRNDGKSEKKLTGVVAELAGIIKGAQVDDWKQDYAEYLTRKYS